MNVPYDRFAEAFLSKITEYDFVNMLDFERNSTIDGFMKRAISAFRHICKYDFTTTGDDNVREFTIKVTGEDPDGIRQQQLDEELAEDLDEIVDIVSEGMLVQWMKPYTYKQESFESVMSTRDFSTYSPAELLLRIGNAHTATKKTFTNMMREYSYTHGDLTDLHL